MIRDDDPRTRALDRRKHLQRHQATLQAQPELAQALDTVMQTQQPVKLDPIQAYKLSSLGLIRLSGDKVVQGCELYQRYFAPTAETPASQRSPAGRRKRGVILTPQGLEKLMAARAEVEWAELKGQRFTLEQLNERTGLSVDTLTKVQACETKVDKQTLKTYFGAFDLQLQPEDFYYPEAASSSEGFPATAVGPSIYQIKFEIDANKVEQEVENITNSEFFRALRDALGEIRQNDDLS